VASAGCLPVSRLSQPLAVKIFLFTEIRIYREQNSGKARRENAKVCLLFEM